MPPSQDDPPPEEPTLLLHSEKTLLTPLRPHLLSLNPTMDLIACVDVDENLSVYRLNGQRAFGLKRKDEDDHVGAIAWKWDGKTLAVGWEGGEVDVLDAEGGRVGGKTAGKGNRDGERDGVGKVECLGWGVNFIDVAGTKRRTGETAEGRQKEQEKGKARGKAVIDLEGTAGKGKTTEDWDAFKDDTKLEDFLQRQPDLEALDVAPDLPDQLAMMDVETLLPRLPSIPIPPANPFMMRAAKADAGAFSSQAEVDSLLHSYHLQDHNSVDVFVRCTENGSVFPSIHDSAEAVEMTLPEQWAIKSRPICHASHPYACSHGMLMSITTTRSGDGRTKIAFVPLTLSFIPTAGIYLHLIASKTAQLRNLLSYLTHTLSRIRSFFHQAQDLPGKFMRNIQETLAENGQGDLVQNLYHLACTGHCVGALREWLVDELAEQGHKRWDNAVNTGLGTVIQLLHENFIPAIDRCAIVISRLRGLAEYHDRGWIFSCPISDFTVLLDMLKNARLLAHTTLLYAADEKRRFTSFSKWLRHSIDFEATEPESQSRAEMETKDPAVDIAMVLEYIQYGMANSDVAPFVKAAKDVGNAGTAGTYEDTKKAIAALRHESVYDEAALSIDHWMGQIGAGVVGLLKQVSQWQESNISMDHGIVLQEGEVGIADMRMVYEPSQVASSSNTRTADSITTYVALSPTAARSTLRLYRLFHAGRISSLPASLHSVSVAALHFPSHTILDAKFADDARLLVLLKLCNADEDATEEDKALPPTASTILISIPYSSVSQPSSILLSTLNIDSPKRTASTSTTFSPPYHSLPSSSHASILLPNDTFSASTSANPPQPLTMTPSLLHHLTIHTFPSTTPPVSTSTPHPPSKPSSTPAPDTTPTTHLPQIPRFIPSKIFPNGRRGRRIVLVLDREGRHYRVLDLDFGAGDDSGDGGGGAEKGVSESDRGKGKGKAKGKGKGKGRARQRDVDRGAGSRRRMRMGMGMGMGTGTARQEEGDDESSDDGDDSDVDMGL